MHIIHVASPPRLSYPTHDVHFVSSAEWCSFPFRLLIASLHSLGSMLWFLCSHLLTRFYPLSPPSCLLFFLFCVFSSTLLQLPPKFTSERAIARARPTFIRIPIGRCRPTNHPRRYQDSFSLRQPSIVCVQRHVSHRCSRYGTQRYYHCCGDSGVLCFNLNVALTVLVPSFLPARTHCRGVTWALLPIHI